MEILYAKDDLTSRFGDPDILIKKGEQVEVVTRWGKTITVKTRDDRRGTWSDFVFSTEPVEEIHEHNPLSYGYTPPSPLTPETWIEVAGYDKNFNSGPVKAGDRYWGVGYDTENPIRYWRLWKGPVPVEPAPSLVDLLAEKFRERTRGSCDVSHTALAEDAIEIVRNYLANPQG